ncbi:MAG: hypothetical protein Q9226_009132, partial [Calogaya cf. arnoldii]
MADLDEAPLPSETAAPATSSVPDIDSDSEDALLDFRHLIPTNNHALPRRGVKDFEYHGTNAQVSVLEGSRQAMHEALSVGRLHTPKSCLVGYFDVDNPGGEDAIENEGVTSGEQRPVVVEKPFGQHARTMGTADKKGGLMLLPEEVIYLVERGSLDVQYRVDGQGEPPEERESAEKDGKEGETGGEEGSEGWHGISMSLQACYANFVGCNGLTLERYTVYAALKRSGYIVSRAPGWYGGSQYPQSTPCHPQSSSMERTKGQTIWQWLYASLFEQEPRKPSPLGDIYRLLHLIPSYTSPPTQVPQTLRGPPPPLATSNPSSSDPPPLRPHFNIHKPQPSFRKTAPGPPDYRICVLDAREQNLPTLSQLDGLLNSVPYDPPLETEKRLYQRLKHGYKNVLLAVVDQGI